jgi:hypothetical protein
MQYKAIVLFLVGIALTIVWGAGLVALTSISPIIVIPRHPVGWLVATVVVFAPGLSIGGWAMKLPKVVRLDCTRCKWSERYVLDTPR